MTRPVVCMHHPRNYCDFSVLDMFYCAFKCLSWSTMAAASLDSSDGLLYSLHLQQLCNSAANVA